MNNQETILTLQTEHAHALLNPRNGFTPSNYETIRRRLNALTPILKIREQAETDENYKQLIPYCIVKRGDKILRYRRAKGSGEERLLLQRSIGFGGHIDVTTTNRFFTSHKHVITAAVRELSEEVGMSDVDYESINITGLVNDESNKVGRVHMGVVVEVTVRDGWEPRQLEDGVAELMWVSMLDFLDSWHTMGLEQWSVHVIKYLLQGSDAEKQRDDEAGKNFAEWRNVLVPLEKIATPPASNSLGMDSSLGTKHDPLFAQTVCRKTHSATTKKRRKRNKIAKSSRKTNRRKNK